MILVKDCLPVLLIQKMQQGIIEPNFDKLLIKDYQENRNKEIKSHLETLITYSNKNLIQTYINKVNNNQLISLDKLYSSL